MFRFSRLSLALVALVPLTALTLVAIGHFWPTALPEPEPDLTDEPDRPDVFAGRASAARADGAGIWAALFLENGGSPQSELAVVLGLAWLAKQQKPDGGWEYDQGSKEERIAATGMALLPFLVAGETHKPRRGAAGRGNYKKVVADGLAFLQKACPLSGPNAGRLNTNMYAQAIGTLALCEAYRATKDPILKLYAQAAIYFVQRSQGPNGSWGYAAGGNGDTSIFGWQVEALQAARLSRDLVVDDRVIRKAVAFLDLASAGEHKSMYGYGDSAGAAPGTALTAVGLWSRACLSGWGPDNPGMADGVAGLMQNPPVGTGPVRNMYYYYHATPVVRLFGGDAWTTWNEGRRQADGTRKGGMRDWLIGTQVRKAGPDEGSWAREAGWFGSSCGRLGTTAMCLLTLEVYHRPMPQSTLAVDGRVAIPEDLP
jgi:hypothetical protein